MIAQLDKIYLKIAWRRVYSRLVSYLFYEGRPLTTKGRWINFFVFLNFQIFSRIPAPRKVVKPIFILGVGRSGSTILGKILSIHSQVGFLNEPKAFWYFLNPQDDIIGSYNKLNNGKYRFDETDANEQVIKKAHNIYGWYLFFSGNRRIVDKYPEHIFRIDYLKAIFPDAKFILLVRDVRDNSESIVNWSKEKGIQNNEGTHDWWGRSDQKWTTLINEIVSKETFFREKIDTLGSTKSHKIRAEVEWFLTMQQVNNCKNRKDTFKIHYEDLVGNIDKNLNELLNFCDLKINKKVKQYPQKILYKKQTSSANLSTFMQEDLELMLKVLGYDV
jgi:hypothetical protein